MTIERLRIRLIYRWLGNNFQISSFNGIPFKYLAYKHTFEPKKSLKIGLLILVFIIMGAITLFLNLGIRTLSWLVVLPFVGVFIDIAAMWLKIYISPVFFWLHIPGGGLFGLVFIYISIRAMVEMWGGQPKMIVEAA